MIDLLNLPGYDPDALMDKLTEKFEVKTDAALARALGVSAPMICRIRQRQIPFPPSLILVIHDVAEYPVDEIRRLAGIPKTVKPEVKKTGKVGRPTTEETCSAS